MRAAFYLFIAGVLLSTDPGCAASADVAANSTKRDAVRVALNERGLMTRQGHIAALAVDAGLDPRTLTHLAIEETQIDALLIERQVFGE